MPRVGRSGANANFDNLKIGYDNNSDDDLDDAGDDLAYDATFGGTSKSVSHDHAGNLIDDGTFRYVYDAWSRLIKVQKPGRAGSARRKSPFVQMAGGARPTACFLPTGVNSPRFGKFR